VPCPEQYLMIRSRPRLAATGTAHANS
jgi:hypothetical protein